MQLWQLKMHLAGFSEGLCMTFLTTSVRGTVSKLFLHIIWHHQRQNEPSLHKQSIFGWYFDCRLWKYGIPLNPVLLNFSKHKQPISVWDWENPPSLLLFKEPLILMRMFTNFHRWNIENVQMWWALGVCTCCYHLRHNGGKCNLPQSFQWTTKVLPNFHSRPKYHRSTLGYKTISS